MSVFCPCDSSTSAGFHSGPASRFWGVGVRAQPGGGAPALIWREVRRPGFGPRQHLAAAEVRAGRREPVLSLPSPTFRASWKIAQRTSDKGRPTQDNAPSDELKIN